MKPDNFGSEIAGFFLGFIRQDRQLACVGIPYPRSESAEHADLKLSPPCKYQPEDELVLFPNLAAERCRRSSWRASVYSHFEQ